ncbi:MAG: hypothetical protein JO069_03060 [Verrucomicrobia bacterium]|nr:hypothetical protein [Verrucomicrobiota bacterium]
MIKPGWRRGQPLLGYKEACAALLLGALMLYAGTPPMRAGETTVLNAPPAEAAPTKLVPDWSFDLTGDYTMGSRFRHLEDLGSQSVSHYELEALRRFHLFDNWYFRVGFDVSRFDFSRSNAVFPYSLNALAGEIALEYWHGEDIGVLVKLSPGVYFTRDHITANSFDIPIEAGAGIKVTKTFSLAVGLTAGLLREWPVLPVGGFVWDINDRLKISALLPEPRISYKFSPAFQIFLDGEYTGGGYRNGPTGDHRTNNAALQYSEYRAGGGLSYTPRKGVSLESTVGYTFEREINYFHAGPAFRTRTGAPYFKLDLSVDLF